MPKISIIVPVYNSEEYLGRCIESIINQSYSDIELILVNDGSSDNSDFIIKKYQKQDQRIRYIFQNNQGVSAARNAGLRLAAGKYILFVDSDDYIENVMLETMINIAEKKDVDLVCCGRCLEAEDEILYKRANIDVLEVFDNEKLAMNILNCQLSWALWDKLIRKECIISGFDVRYDICEDILFLFSNLKNIKKCIYVDECFYHWTYKKGSLSQRRDGKTMYSCSLVQKELIRQANDISNKLHEVTEEQYVSSTLWTLKSVKSKIEDDEYYKTMKMTLLAYLRKNLFFIMAKNHNLKYKIKVLLYCLGIKI